MTEEEYNDYFEIQSRSRYSFKMYRCMTELLTQKIICDNKSRQLDRFFLGKELYNRYFTEVLKWQMKKKHSVGLN